MAAEWTPATGLERALLAAVRREDHDGCLRLLSGVGLLVLVERDRAGRTTGWVTSAADDRTYLHGYTSAESLAAAVGEQAEHLTLSLPELARRAPDSRWWLAINAGLPIQVLLPPQYLTSQVVPSDDGSGGASVGDVSARAYAETAAARVDPRLAVRAFEPGNDVEAAMLAATQQGDPDAYLKALMLAEVLAPRRPGELAAPGEPDFTWPTSEFEGQPCVVLFTSEQRLTECFGDIPFVRAEALAVIRDWPDRALALVVNPHTPVGASLRGAEVRRLAEWAAETGLLATLEPVGEPPATAAPPGAPETLQKLLPAGHCDFYRERGYRLASGYVHRLSDVGQGVTPAHLLRVLGLDGPDSPFPTPDGFLHALRWPAYGDGRYGDPRPVLGRGVVPQTRVTGAPLPHGAMLCRIDGTGEETVVARYDADAEQWTAAEQGAG